jgi:hypothetical protein
VRGWGAPEYQDADGRTYYLIADIAEWLRATERRDS